jgi:Tol biopolymer transport system component
LSKRDVNSRNMQMNILSIRSAETGKVRELKPNLSRLNIGNVYPLWSPDGGSLLVNASDKQHREGIYRIDAQNSEATPVFLRDPGEERMTARAWSPDGKILYIVRAGAKSKVETLVARDMQSGQEREIIRRHFFGVVALSPDGRRLAVAAFDGSTRSGSILVIPAEGGEPRELLRTSNSGPESIGLFVTWLPDGQHMIFRKGPAGARETFRISAEGGAAVRYGAEWTVGPPAINPDGRQVAFPLGDHKIEIWAMENFLPAKPGK